MINTISIAINGVKYEGWINVKVTRSIETFCNSFSFTSSQVKSQTRYTDLFPVKCGDSCRIYVNNIQVIYGWVEKLTISDGASSQDSGNHSITVEGRDRTCDIVDSTAAALNLIAPISLENIAKNILKELSLSAIKVINNYKLPSLTNTAATEVGVSYYTFLEYYARKLQVIPITNGEGNIEFIRAGTQLYNTALSREVDDANALQSSSLIIDYSKRFNKYELITQNDYTTLNLPPDPDSNGSIQAVAVDTRMRKSRMLAFAGEDSSTTKEDNQRRVNWEANFRRGQSLVYNATVPYFKPRDDEGIWLPNKLVRVIDRSKDINTELLVTSVEYSQSSEANGGSLVALRFLTSDAFTQEVNKSKKSKLDKKEADDYQIVGIPEPSPGE